MAARNHYTAENQNDYYAIIVAGGSGSRMQAAVPKQFLLLNGTPVLMHTLKVFTTSKYTPKIIVVLPEAYHEFWRNLCIQHQFDLHHELVSGGATRFNSVKNALGLLPDASLVAIHDAVRPLIDESIIDKAFEAAAKQGTAVAAVQSRDSVRQVKGASSQSLLRSEIYLVQTPQSFNTALLKQAYNQTYHEGFTDDASVVEQFGHAIQIIEGSYRNFKITYPEDIILAETLLNQKAAF